MPQASVARSAREQIGCPLWEEVTAQTLLRFSVTQHEQQFQKVWLAVSKEGYYSLYLLYTPKPLQEVIDEFMFSERNVSQQALSDGYMFLHPQHLLHCLQDSMRLLLLLGVFLLYICIFYCFYLNCVIVLWVIREHFGKHSISFIHFSHYTVFQLASKFPISIKAICNGA